MGAFRISNDLERIGDLAENLAKRAVLLTGEVRIEEVMLQLHRMVQFARDQLRLVLESYERRDVAEAFEVWRKDRELDALNNSMRLELQTGFFHFKIYYLAFFHAIFALNLETGVFFFVLIEVASPF